MTKKFELRVDVDPVRNKWKHMELDHHLQMSAMAGLLGNNGGASGLLNDRSHQDEITQTVICRVQSRIERLDLMDLFKKGLPSLHSTASDATHFVIGAFYGAEAYCVLVQEEAESNLSNKAEQLKTALEGNATIVETELQLEGKCRLYSDLQNDSVCECSLMDAFKQCSLMIDRVKTNDEEAIPISYLLCPLQNLLGPIWTTGSKYYDVDAALVDRCSRFWVGMEQVSGRMDLYRPFFQKIGHITFAEFESSVVEYQMILQNNLKEATVKARRTENGKEELEKTLDLAETHLIFKPAVLKLWLFSTYNEWLIANEMVNSWNGASLLFHKDELNTKLEKEYAIVLVIPKVRRLLDPLTMKESWNDNSKLLLRRAERSLIDFFCDDDGDATEDEEEKEGAHQLVAQYQKKGAKNIFGELAAHFEKNICEKPNVQIFVSVDDNCSEFCEYRVYSRYNLLIFLYQLPFKSPRDVQIRRMKTVDNQNASAFRVNFQWDGIEDETADEFISYLVEFRLKGRLSDAWTRQKFTMDDDDGVILRFKHKLDMEIRVAIGSCIGRSDFSQVVCTDSALIDNVTGEESESSSR